MKFFVDKYLLHAINIYCPNFPGGTVVKNLPANAGDTDLLLGLRRSPGERNGNPLQYSCLENPMDPGDWWATVHCKELDTNEHLHKQWKYQSDQEGKIWSELNNRGIENIPGKIAVSDPNSPFALLLLDLPFSGDYIEEFSSLLRSTTQK